MIDKCSDALNAKNKLEGQVKQNGFHQPYTDPSKSAGLLL